MKKVISLFKRNYDTDRLIRDELVEGAEWVIAGEGKATRKWDGTCCLIKDGLYYKRYEVKQGKTPPLVFIPASDVDPKTGKQQGWVWVDPKLPENRWHYEAWNAELPDGTYELCGEKVENNPEHIQGHKLIPHGIDILENVPRNYAGLRQYLSEHDIEGIVWWHPDGRMVKIKTKDFGIKRPKSKNTE